MARGNKISEEDINSIKDLYIQATPLQEIADKFKITYIRVQKICETLSKERKENERVMKQNLTEKLCPFCEKVKPREDFDKDTNSLSGMTTHCHQCRRGHSKNHASKEETKEKRRIRDQSPEGREKTRAIDKRRYTEEARREDFLKYRREYSKRESQRNHVNQRDRERRSEDIGYKLKRNLKGRVCSAIKASKTRKTNTTVVLLGCTIENLKTHLESLWADGMNWENYGFGDDKWHIDHIIPCAAFDLTIKEEQEKCFHYSNLQPLWQSDNFFKGARVIGQYIEENPPEETSDGSDDLFF